MKSLCDLLRLRKPSRRVHQSVFGTNSLESRVLLATLVGTNKVTYQDADGDDVTVTFSKAFLSTTNVNAIFTFDTGTVDGNNATKQQLLSINLLEAVGVQGTNITSVAVRSAARGGDGFAAVGEIVGLGFDLGTVTIDGDLGRVMAGDQTAATPGLAGLTVHSLGRFGTSTGASALDSNVQGKLTALKVKTDIRTASVNVTGGIDAQIGTVTIGGSLLGGDVPNSGRIYADGNIGAVAISGDIQGGSILFTGGIQTLGKIASVTIGGSLLGGSGSATTGYIISGSDMGAVKIVGDVVGEGFDSAFVRSGGKLASVSVGGSLIGGSGTRSGSIRSAQDMGPVTIGVDVIGGDSRDAGSIQADTNLVSVTIKGSLLGGTGENSGLVWSNLSLGPVTITGNVVGGNGGRDSGRISSFGSLGAVTIGGSLTGGLALGSGSVDATSSMGLVKIAADLTGVGPSSGRISAGEKLAGVTIGGDVNGGTNDFSGTIASGLDMGPVSVSGNVTGLAGRDSGRISSGAKLGNVTIGGDLRGGGGVMSGNVTSVTDMGVVTITGSVFGGFGDTGSVISGGKLTSVSIGGDLVGGAPVIGDGIPSLFGGSVRSASNMGAVSIKGSILGGTNDSSGIVKSGGLLTSVTLGGSLRGGFAARSGAIEATGRINEIKIAGNISGGAALANLTGRITADQTLGTLTVGGSILGGTANDSGLIEVNGELTTVTITGNIVGGDTSSTLVNSGAIVAGRIATLTVNGSVISGHRTGLGFSVLCGGVAAENDIGTAMIRGSLIGNPSNPVQLFARGQIAPTATVDLAIRKLNVGRRVEYGQILAGVNVDSSYKNADAQIGSVSVGGDWIASNLVAGATAGIDGLYGNDDDVKMSGGGVKDVPTAFSKIASLTIGGQAYGTVGGTDHYGIVAENVGSLKVKGGATTFSIVTGNGNDDFLVGLLGDFKVNEKI